MVFYFYSVSVDQSFLLLEICFSYEYILMDGIDMEIGDYFKGIA